MARPVNYYMRVVESFVLTGLSCMKKDPLSETKSWPQQIILQDASQAEKGERVPWIPVEMCKLIMLLFMSFMLQCGLFDIKHFLFLIWASGNRSVTSHSSTIK